MGIKIFYSNQAVLCFRPKTVVVSRLPRQSFWREHLTVPSIHRDRLGFEHTNRPSRLWPAISMSLESPFFFFACFITLFIKSEQYSKTFKKKRGPTAVSPLPTIAANYSMSVISSLHTHLCFALQRYSDFSIRAIPKTDETSSQHHVEHHHYNEPYGKADSAEVAVLAVGGFGYQFLDHHVQHGTSGKG